MANTRDVFRKLTHKVSVSATTITVTGDPVIIDTLSDVKCYIVPRSRRFVRSGREEVETSHDVYFDKDGLSVEMGNVLSNGLDVNGVTLISTAVVEYIAKWSHPFRGFETVVISAKAI